MLPVVFDWEELVKCLVLSPHPRVSLSPLEMANPLCLYTAHFTRCHGLGLASAIYDALVYESLKQDFTFSNHLNRAVIISTCFVTEGSLIGGIFTKASR